MKRFWKRFIVAAVMLLGCIVFGYWSNNSLQITQYTYTSDEIPVGFDGYTIVHLSDLHNKIFGRDNLPLREAVAALHPDIIVLTGDIIDHSNHMDIDAALRFMSQMPQLAPTYYITGNHEESLRSTVMQEFITQITDYGVHTLSGEMVTLTAKNGDTISLIGIADLDLQSDVLAQLMEYEDRKTLHLLLAHEPQYLSDYAATGVDVVFSGHAHGGQFRIPFTHQGIFAPDQGLFPKLTEGVWVQGDTTMYISRGLGNSAFPQRLFNRPEIVCVTLRAFQDAS